MYIDYRMHERILLVYTHYRPNELDEMWSHRKDWWIEYLSTPLYEKPSAELRRCHRSWIEIVLPDSNDQDQEEED